VPLPAEFELPNAEVFDPLLEPARYKGAWGGRGGGKDYFFADMMLEHALYQRGLFSVCIREVQRTLRDSVKRLLEARLRNVFGLGEADGFKIFRDTIETPGDGLITFTGMQDHTSESIKSIEGANRFYWTEAQTASATSLKLLRPTAREADVEMWFAWNPKLPPDKEHPENSIDGLLRGQFVPPPPRAKVIEAQWYDNPWFPPGLEEERTYDLKHRQAEDYKHIWEGAYETRSEARVFKNWIVRDFETPTNAIMRRGADFGFSVDPSVLVSCFVGDLVDTGVLGADGERIHKAVANDKGRHLFVDYEAHRVGCDVDHIPALFAGNDWLGADDPTKARWKNPYGDAGIPDATKWAITADSSNPQSISYLNRHGFNVKPAIKGKGSIEEGVEFLKAYTIVVHTRCKHTADELTYYSFKVDKQTLLVLPVLEDKKNHVIDALRYAVEDVRRGRGFFG